MQRTAQKIEFGDFQTPLRLARQCCRVAAATFPDPQIVIEPTCGQGSFLVAAIEQFDCDQVLGFELSDQYRRDARQTLGRIKSDANWAIAKRDFFDCDWAGDRSQRSGSVLYLGNPPWVTNSQLGVLGSRNLPAKSNVLGERGIDAMTGRSNFDIAEAMLQRLLAAMRPDLDCLAMLVKTSTARKLVRYAWKQGKRFSHVSLRLIDAQADFGVNVDACLLMIKPTTAADTQQVCLLARSLEQPADETAFGWLDQDLVADPTKAAATACLAPSPSELDPLVTWRSGVKHDVASVLELRRVDQGIESKTGTAVSVEDDLLYPLAKGADVANGRTACEQRRILLTQRSMNDSTDALRTTHPLAWRYLQTHATRFAARQSSIYRNRDPFALFGIGPYTFSPWKVAICGLYKRLAFTVLGPVAGKPVILDDTCYFLPLENAAQAHFVQELLTSSLAGDYFNARIFWDSKRPITAGLLRGISLRAVAEKLNRGTQYERLFATAVAS